jgi:hypothetical protein
MREVRSAARREHVGDHQPDHDGHERVEHEQPDHAQRQPPVNVGRHDRAHHRDQDEHRRQRAEKAQDELGGPIERLCRRPEREPGRDAHDQAHQDSQIQRNVIPPFKPSFGFGPRGLGRRRHRCGVL